MCDAEHLSEDTRARLAALERAGVELVGITAAAEGRQAGPRPGFRAIATAGDIEVITEGASREQAAARLAGVLERLLRDVARLRRRVSHV